MTSFPRLGPQLAGYIVADTNPGTQGWRVGTMTLSGPNGPNWKTVVAQRQSYGRMMDQARAARSRAIRASLVLQDARVRRVSPAPGLAGLGYNALDLNAQMVKGARYLFHFTYGWLGLKIDPQNLASVIARDTNFSQVVGATESAGLQFSFIYNGQGSTVGDAGREMQNVANDYLGMNPINFAVAEGGPVSASAGAVPAGVTVYATSPDGTVIQFSDGSVLDTTSGMVINPDGTVRSAAGTSPGGPASGPGGSPGSFNLPNFFKGIDLTTAIALGLGAVVLGKIL